MSPGGSDSNNGSAVAPWRTIAKANATLSAGDVCRIAAGAYDGNIAPARNGSPTARITYIGDLSNPRNVVVTGNVAVDKAYVTVKGLEVLGSIRLTYTSESAKAVRDSVVHCQVGSGIGFLGAKDCVIAHCRGNGAVSFLMNNEQTGPPGIVNSERDTLRGNNLDFGTITYKGFQVRGFTQYCVVDSNRFKGMFAVAIGGDVQGRYIYNSHHNLFRDNRWTFEGDAPLSGGAMYVAYALRDSSSYNVFERDSMLCGLQSGVPIGGRLVNAGNAAWVGQAQGNRWTGCVFLTTATTYTQDKFRNSTLDHCVFASSGMYALDVLNVLDNVKIQNCTFYSKAAAAIRMEGDATPGGNELTSNIFVTDWVDQCRTRRSVFVIENPAGMSMNYNLYYANTAASGVTARDQSLYWLSTYCSRPGPGTPWASATGNDVSSAYGNPMFADPNFATFDAHLLSGSAAHGLAQDGADAGAFSAPDTIPPNPVADLAADQVYDEAAVVRWTAPGGSGTVGVASEYDMRYSTSPISSSNFSGATPVSGLSAPQGSGTQETFPIMGLTKSTAYYVALRARDASGNWSDLSNVLSFQTKSVDDVPPAAIQDVKTGP